MLARGARALGPGKAQLLEHIEATGSISAAARAMKMSYRRAWQLVEAMNASFRAPLVLTAIGGARGGGASVTPYGRRLLHRFRAMERRAASAIAADLAFFRRELKAR